MNIEIEYIIFLKYISLKYQKLDFVSVLENIPGTARDGDGRS